MNKLLILFLMGILIPDNSFGQTYYYNLIKIVHDRTTTTNVSGGQFITFISDICYESNKEGIGVGHGTLQRNNSFSNSRFKVYMGKSYWGSDATFKFTSDLTTLNVVTESGDVYLYKRSTPPANATTSSLIRRSSSGGGASYPVQPTYPAGDGGYGGGTGGSSQGNLGTSGSTGHQCRLCGGTGRKVSQVHPGNAKQTKWCGECRKRVHTGHFHTQCDLCNGNGWIK